MNIRHGDINLHKIDIDVNGLEEIKHQGSFVIAEGETTGHKHVITIPDITKMKLYKDSKGGIICVLKEDATIVHPEHKELVIPAGTYRESREREVDLFSGKVRRVID